MDNILTASMESAISNLHDAEYQLRNWGQRQTMDEFDMTELNIICDKILLERLRLKGAIEEV